MKTYIWGAGSWGKIAYEVLQKQFDIVGFIDKDSLKKDTIIDGLHVYSPDVLLNADSEKPNIIVAIDLYWQDVFNELNNTYHIEQAILFREEYICAWLSTSLDAENCDSRDEVIIRFTDDMGNQMFQYALGRKLASQGAYVTADFSLCIKPGQDKNLEEIFENVSITQCNKSKLLEYLSPMKKYGSTYMQFNEELNKGMRSVAQDIFSVKRGCINGYWTNPGYFAGIENEIKYAFNFKRAVIQADESKLVELAEEIKECESVSLHVRGGDYLTSTNSNIFGNICTYNYYSTAIDRIIEHRLTNNLHIYVFTNDKIWYSKNFQSVFSEKKIDNVTVIDSDMFKHYQDWYDMYLMTICKNNIIANSTFSWWGAWLNQTPDKFVVAPKKFTNVYDEPGKCPDEWVRI